MFEAHHHDIDRSLLVNFLLLTHERMKKADEEDASSLRAQKKNVYGRDSRRRGGQGRNEREGCSKWWGLHASPAPTDRSMVMSL